MHGFLLLLLLLPPSLLLLVLNMKYSKTSFGNYFIATSSSSSSSQSPQLQIKLAVVIFHCKFQYCTTTYPLPHHITWWWPALASQAVVLSIHLLFNARLDDFYQKYLMRSKVFPSSHDQSFSPTSGGLHHVCLIINRSCAHILA